MTGRIFSWESVRFSEFPRRFDRPRLDGTLKEALETPLVSVVAGQGYGKTSSIYSFLEQYPAVTMWIQLSGQDNIGWHFWENVCACVTLRNPWLGKLLLKIGFPETEQQFDRFYDNVVQGINRLRHSTENADLRWVMVYDNFHTIQESATLRLFDRILSFPFPNVSIVLIGRNEPLVKTQALLSKGLLFKITADDLRFSREEIAAYFALRHLSISQEDLACLYRDTEGWPQMISLVAQDAVNHGEREFHYSPELVKVPLFNIIDRSFFSFLDPETRKFLVKLSLGGYWPLELLRELDESGTMTDTLEQLTPLIRYDFFLNSYRIHGILIDFLTEKQEELSPEEQREVNLKSAAWCLKNGLYMDAATYYERARDLRGFLNLTLALPIIVPKEVASFFLAIVDRLLREAEPALLPASGADPETVEILWHLCFILRPRLLFALRRFEDAGAVCRRAIAEFREPFQSGISARVLTTAYLCLAFIEFYTCRRTGILRFLPLFQKAYYYFENYDVTTSQGFTQGNVPSYICQVGFPAGHNAFEEYLRSFAPVAPLIAKMGDGHLDGMEALGRCEYCYYRGDLGAAENFARRALIQARESRQFETENRALFFLLRIAVHGGNLPEIEEVFRKLTAQLDIDEFQNRYLLYDLECCWFYTQTGAAALIAPWLRNEVEENGPVDFFHPLVILAKARCMFAERQYQSALDILGQPGIDNSLDSFLLGKLEKTVLSAVCRLRLKDRRAAAADLNAAWEISAVGGFDMPFVEMGEDMRNLVSPALDGPADPAAQCVPKPPEPSKKTPKCRIPPEWLESVRNRAAAYSKMTVLAADCGPRPSRPPQDGETILRRRELAVLSALSQGLTREAIARQERISLNGVKEIIKNLYRKLDALNQADAVRIAIARGFLKNSSR
jgi:LuxR family maltose regulon positive regulatory protein